ncbi:MAG TPA: PEP-CTERM sorting domain-containing protein [Tepidisphaeraceae bacterium]|jgi:hypothetical protein
MQTKYVMLAAIAVLAGATGAFADSGLVQWNSGTGADGNYYQRIDTGNASPLTFGQALFDAAAQTIVVGSTTYEGQLAVLSPDYTDAFTFINDNVMYPASNPAGQGEMYWVGASSPDGNASPNNWSWINGTAVPDSVVNTWNIDHGEGPGPEGAGYFQNNGQLWDYITTASSGQAYGYVVEFVVPEPASICAAGTLLAGCVIRRRRRP